jgi:hypothetical protein
LEEPDPELEPERSSDPPPPPGPELPPEAPLSSDPERSSVLVPPLDPDVPLELPLEEEPPWSSPVVVPDEASSDPRLSFFSDFLESSSSAFGLAFPCVATGTEAGVAAIVLAELR